MISAQKISVACKLLAAIFCLLLDGNYLYTAQSLADVSYGRLVLGVFLQLAGTAVAGGVPLGARPPGGTAPSTALPYKVAAMFIPAVVIIWIGSSLVFSGLHEGHLPIAYRGNG